MTTIQDYIDSIRQSLSIVEQSCDTTEEPPPPFNGINLSTLDAIANALANRYQRNKRAAEVRSQVSRSE